MNGYAAHYERTGDPEALSAVIFFFDALANHHSYATGAWQTLCEQTFAIGRNCGYLVDDSMAIMQLLTVTQIRDDIQCRSSPGL